MAKHGARAITSKCGAVDILEALGVDVECDVSLVKRSIERAGIGIFNGMSGKVHPQALYRILSQIRFGTILNVAGSLANPALPTYGVRGVYSREMVLPIARAMKEIGYKRAFVVHGQSADGARGMDEISTLGDTSVAELTDDGEIHEFIISPEMMGIREGDESAILHRADREAEAIKILRVLSGEDKGPRRDIVCLNAAPVLYITGHASDLRDGVEKAANLLDMGLPIKKLRAWVAEQNSDPGERLERFEKMLALACASS
jgi:anthranilate phosphoribosyltransferase